MWENLLLKAKSMLNLRTKLPYQGLISGLEKSSDVLRKIVTQKGGRNPGSCKWVFEESEYNSWLSSKHSDFLWLYGHPGTGKTMLATFLVESLLDRAKVAGSMIVAYHFCEHQHKERNTPCAILRRLVSQFVEAEPILINHLEEDYERLGHDMFSDFTVMGRVFKYILNDMHMNIPYCLIDGLDECDDQSSKQLLEVFWTVFKSSGSDTKESIQFKLIVISREVAEIKVTQGELGPEGCFDIISIGKEKIRSDVDNFIRNKISSLPYRKELRNENFEPLITRLSEKAEGSFLWVALTAEQLANDSASDILDKIQTDKPLEKMFDFYETILQRIDSIHKDTVLEILELVIGAVRPLSVLELATARCVLHHNTHKAVQWETRLELFKQDIRWCRPLVTEEDGKVVIIHFTASQYLLSSASRVEFRVDQTIAHSKLASVSFNFFTRLEHFVGSTPRNRTNKADIRDSESLRIPTPVVTAQNWSPEKAIQDPFLMYAMHHWIDHFDASGSKKLDINWDHEFFNTDSPIHNSWLQVYWERHEQNPVFPKGFSPLHIASFCGSKKLAKMLFSVKPNLDIDATDDQNRSPLFMAASKGNSEVARYLLTHSRPANTEVMDADQFRPIDVAVSRGDAKMVELLLKYGASTAPCSSEEPSPLHMSVQAGLNDIAVILLRKDSKEGINLLGEDGNTALHIAALHGDSVMTEILLRHGADTNVVNDNSQTPLMAGCEAGNMRAVKSLLDDKLLALLNRIANYYPHAMDLSELAEIMKKDGFRLGFGEAWIRSVRELFGFSVSKQIIEQALDPYKADVGVILGKAVEMNLLGIAKLLITYGANVHESVNMDSLLRKGDANIIEFLLPILEPSDDTIKQLLVTACRYRYRNIPLIMIRYMQEHGFLLRDIHLGLAAEAMEVDAMEEVVDRSSSKGISECAILAATKNSDNVVGILELFLELDTRLEITPNVLTAVANIGTDDVRICLPPFLLRKASSQKIVEFDAQDSEKTKIIAIAAATNTIVAEALLSTCPEIEITARALAIIANFSKLNEFMRLLLRTRPDSQIKALTITAGEPSRAELIKVLLDIHDAQITEEALLLIENEYDEEWTPLHYDARRCDVGVKLLLKHGRDVAAKGRDGMTPLHCAAARGNQDDVVALLSAGTELDVLDNSRRTPLHWAAYNGHADVVEFLLTKRASTTERDYQGRTALHLALIGGSIDTISRLIRSDEEANDKTEMTALALAQTQGYEAAMQLLLEYHIEMDAKSIDGLMALHWAAANGHEVMTRVLLDRGANHYGEYSDGRTPLHMAAANGHEAVTRLLLDRGAYPAVIDTDGRTLLHMAAANGHEAVTRLLLDRGAYPDIISSDERTPLRMAAANGHETVTRLLLDRGADHDATSDGRTLLHMAAANGYEAVTRLLLDRGVDLYATSSDGRMALHMAAANGHEVVTRLLVLEYGVNRSATSSDGRTALHWAAANGHETVTRLLLEHGVPREIKSTNGLTALRWAVANGHEGVAQLLE